MGDNVPTVPDATGDTTESEAVTIQPENEAPATTTIPNVDAIAVGPRE